jgi:hypothetical protein
MFHVLQIVSIILVSIGVTLTLAHALELPGKLRLDKDTYLAVQSIYYPGFTIAAGFGEFGAMLATLLLSILTPFGSAAFWLTMSAFVSLVIMHALYWTITHPVNKFWLKDQQLQGAGAAFFAVGGKSEAERDDRDWVPLRDRWEYSHVARAGFAMLALIALATAATR